MKKRYLLAILLLLASLLLLQPVQAQTENGANDETAVVQFVLFYSPSCPHCHAVINDVLRPLQEQYGSQVQILGIDTTQAVGSKLYQNAVDHFRIPQERLGVPTLVFANVILVGSEEIPQQLPDLMEEGLAAGGVGWPEIPGLRLAVPDLPPSADPETATAVSADPPAPTTAPLPAAEEPEPETAVPSPVEADSLDAIETTLTNDPPPDPVGFTLAGALTIGMLTALAFASWRLLAYRGEKPLTRLPNTTGYNLLVAALLIIGLITAGYLSYVEITQTEAVCGPVGQCNIVQSSPYATILGVPVALLGILNYLAVAALWVGQQFLSPKWSRRALIGLAALTLAGTIFSIYLTLLELLVIHAVCAWCLTSALVTTLLMLLTVPYLRKRPSPPSVGVQFG